MRSNFPFYTSNSKVFTVLTIVWIAMLLLTLAHLLRRTDLDPVTKLMWVLVVIMVPIAGVLFYWFIAPNEPCRVLGRDDVRLQPDEPIKCVTCQTVIPGDATVCPKCGWSYVRKPGAPASQ